MTLHPTAQALLESIKLQNGPAWPELPVEESRATFDSLTHLFGQGPDVDRVVDLKTDSGVPVRCYYPQQEQGSASSPQQKLPCVMYFHGGGWVLGNIETHDTLCRFLSNASHRVVCSVDYGLAPENKYPVAIDDCHEATQYIARHSERLDIDAQRLAVAGDSAGGNLAAAVCLKVRDKQADHDGAAQIEKQVLIYPVIDTDFDTDSYEEFATDHMLTRETMQWFWEQYLGSDVAKRRDTAEYACLGSAQLESLPPSLILLAEYDVLRSEGEMFAESLARAGNNVNSSVYPGMLHGFVHHLGLFADGKKAIQEIADFLTDAST